MNRTGGGVVPGVRRIAVLRANAIGDYIVAEPALDALRRTYPGAEIVLVGTRWHAEFLAGRPGPVDRAVALPPVPGVTAPPDAPARSLAGLAGELGVGEVDIGVQIHGGGRYSTPVIRALGPRLAVGLRAPDAGPLDRSVPYLYYQHETVRFLEAVALVGATTPRIEPWIAVTERDRRELCERVGALPAPLACLHPGASDPRRRWPAERFASVGDHLAARGMRVVVTGIEAERDVVEQVAGRMTAPALPLVGVLGLGALAALLQRATILVGNDSGPRHLAGAVGTRTVAIYWVGNMINAGPLTRAGHRPLISWTLACPACGVPAVRAESPARPGPPRCPHDTSFVADVGTDAVIEAVDDLLDG